MHKREKKGEFGVGEGRARKEDKCWDTASHALFSSMRHSSALNTEPLHCGICFVLFHREGSHYPSCDETVGNTEGASLKFCCNGVEQMDQLLIRWKTAEQMQSTVPSLFSIVLTHTHKHP